MTLRKQAGTFKVILLANPKSGERHRKNAIFSGKVGNKYHSSSEGTGKWGNILSKMGFASSI
jgi:hypothetical protein